MRPYGPGNGTYGKGKRRGLPSHAGGTRRGARRPVIRKKIEKGVFPLGEETGKNAPLHFYCSGLTQIGH